ncbi:hypothetical protein K438DRAFT_1575465, partial [Mycena galopus ATCC 62051]
GLASAIALKGAGHDVLVLEKESQLGGPDTAGGSRAVYTDSLSRTAARLPPNGCKILFDWGLEAEIRANAVVGEGFTVYKYEGKESRRDYLGTHRWDPELLSEARGDFLQMRHGDLLRILYHAALREPSKKQLNGHTSRATIAIEFGAEVLDADFDECSVTLRSGAVYYGDVLIGADGASGFLRQRLLAEEDEPGDDELEGLAVYRQEYELLKSDGQLNLLQRNYSPERCGRRLGTWKTLPGRDEDVVFWVYTPDSGEEGTWTKPANGISRISSAAAIHCPIERLATLAGPATCVQMKNHYELKSWVSKSGKVLLLGEAAHPFPIISLHTYSVAIEDAAFIGAIFSHTRNPARITEFLHAFEENRKPRCRHIDQAEKQYVAVMALPDGPMQAGRDAAFRANEAAGRNVMDAEDMDLQQMWDDMRLVFGYDPADDADEWWVSWGRLRDSPHANASKGTASDQEIDISQCGE